MAGMVPASILLSTSLPSTDKVPVLAVVLSSFGSRLKNDGRTLIAWMAPRGIVSATSNRCALGLSQAGVGGGSEKLIPITFVVIVATALLYGLSGATVAKALSIWRRTRRAADHRCLSRGPGDRAGAQGTGGDSGRVDRRSRSWRRPPATRACPSTAATPQRSAPRFPPELDEFAALLMTDDDGLNGMLAADLVKYFGH